MAEQGVSQAGSRALRHGIVLCWVTALACGSPCEGTDVIAEGTRFRFTSVSEQSVCGDAIVLAAGESFELVAGGTSETAGNACDYTVAAGAPEFANSKMMITSCAGDVSRLGARCGVTMDGCGGDVRFYPGELPEGSESVQSEFHIKLNAPPGCFQPCDFRFPVTVQRI